MGKTKNSLFPLSLFISSVSHSLSLSSSYLPTACLPCPKPLPPPPPQLFLPIQLPHAAALFLGFLIHYLIGKLLNLPGQSLFLCFCSFFGCLFWVFWICVSWNLPMCDFFGGFDVGFVWLLKDCVVWALIAVENGGVFLFSGILVFVESRLCNKLLIGVEMGFCV